MMKHTHQSVSKCRQPIIWLLVLLPLWAQAQNPADTLLWKNIHLGTPAMKVLPEPMDSYRQEKTGSGSYELELRLGLGRQSASFGQLSEWTTDSLINWFYSQPGPLERLFTELESEIGFLPEPIAYEGSLTYHAAAAYYRWLSQSVRAGGGISLGISSLNGKAAMIAVPFSGEPFEPQPLEGTLSGDIVRAGLFAEASWYASGGGRWRPLAGISSAWSHLSWKDTKLQVAGIDFRLPEPDAVSAFSGGVHAGARWQSVQSPFFLEARLFYQRLFTGYSTSVVGLSLSIIRR
jgi:hypothetical protein